MLRRLIFAALAVLVSCACNAASVDPKDDPNEAPRAPSAADFSWDGRSAHAFRDTSSGLRFLVPATGYRVTATHFERSTPPIKLKHEIKITAGRNEVVRIDVWNNVERLELSAWFDKYLRFMVTPETRVDLSSAGRRGVPAIVVEQPRSTQATARRAAVLQLGDRVVRVTCLDAEDSRARAVFDRALGDSRRRGRAMMPRLQALLLAVATLALSGPAASVYQCGPDTDDCKCGMNDPYPCCSNGGNCTWWAWDQACCHWAVGLPGWGNANQWAGNAKAHPNYQVLSYPVVNSIANRVSGSYGHVAWVTAVKGSSVTVTEQNCWGGWGHSTATRDKSYYDGGFIVPKGQCECKPGESQTQSCGNCGERARSCNSSCQWGSWGTCGGQGSCTPGETESQSCGSCGQQQRTCDGDCHWSELSTCTEAATFSAGSCSTGKSGVCAEGSEQCVDGDVVCTPSVEPSPEKCNGLDDDCDGEVDEEGCWNDAGAAVPPISQPGTGGGQATRTVAAGTESGCSLTAGDSPAGSSRYLLLALLGLAAAARRRTWR